MAKTIRAWRPRTYDPRRKKKTTQDLRSERATDLQAEGLRGVKRGQDIAVSEAEKNRQTRSGEVRQRGLQSVASGGGRYADQAAQQLLGSTGEQRETYADRLARVYAQTRRNYATIAERDTKRLAGQPDRSQMIFQAPGGVLRTLKGRDADLPDRPGEVSPNTYGALAGMQRDLSRAYPEQPDTSAQDAFAEQQRRYNAAREYQISQSPWAGNRQGLNDMLQAKGVDTPDPYEPNMPGGPGATPPPQPQQPQAHGMAELRGLLQPQTGQQQPQLTPEDNAYVKDRMAGYSVAHPGVEGPGSKPIDPAESAYNVKLQELDTGFSDKASWTSQMRLLDKNAKLARPDKKEGWEKDKAAHIDKFMRAMPDPDDRIALIKLVGLNPSWAGAGAGADGQSSVMPAATGGGAGGGGGGGWGGEPTTQPAGAAGQATGQPTGQMNVPVPGYDRGIMAPSRFAPQQTPEQQRKEYSDMIAAQGQAAQESGAEADTQLAAIEQARQARMGGGEMYEEKLAGMRATRKSQEAATELATGAGRPITELESVRASKAPDRIRWPERGFWRDYEDLGKAMAQTTDQVIGELSSAGSSQARQAVITAIESSPKYQASVRLMEAAERDDWSAAATALNEMSDVPVGAAELWESIFNFKAGKQGWNDTVASIRRMVDAMAVAKKQSMAPPAARPMPQTGGAAQPAAQ